MREWLEEASVYEKQIAEQVRVLPPARQREVLDFVEFLRQKQPPRERPPIEGSLKHLGIHLDEEDLKQARREMWGNFPRELAD
jgi:Protein of unknown function (DUF2281)